ncbi:hypothetical protein LCGC14_2296890 [marine sediment metagenome]|uniref:Uncharacterized protein n=1 Tax=marine sediment metagenome TaxID=412755 RepID=A0A0F9CQ68_9ZZZZ
MKRESIYLVHFEGAKELNKKEWDKFVQSAFVSAISPREFSSPPKSNQQ